MTRENLSLDEIIRALNLTLLTRPVDFSSVRPGAVYTSDLLSCVMAGAPQHSLWITLQAHNNIVAVAALLGICAVIITENALPDLGTIEKANEENVVLLSSQAGSFEIAGRLWELGLRPQ